MKVIYFVMKEWLRMHNRELSNDDTIYYKDLFKDASVVDVIQSIERQEM